MQDVPRFTEVRRYRAVIVENVTDILKWVHLDAWLTRMRRLGYAHRTVVLNSAFATILGPGAPELSDRVYFVFWRDHYPTPDFPKWTRPLAWCPACDRDVHAVYLAKPGPRRAMRYGTQYIYRCPQTSCRAAVVHPYCLPAAAAIDWTLPAGRIGTGRNRCGPRRWPASSRDFAATPTRCSCRPAAPGNTEARPTTAPMRACTTRETEALLVPVEARTGKHARTTADPMRAQTARAQDALVVPLRNHGVARPADTHPLVTFAAGGTHQGLIMRNNTGGAEMSTRSRNRSARSPPPGTSHWSAGTT